jgi:hypothetical protein
MGRIAGIAQGIRNSGARLGPLDAVFAGFDYYDGKQTGEDDIRAAAGAAGSTVGGWGGALAGGAAGAAAGSVVPGIGTAIGGAVGAIAGGMGGGFLGGWSADRADELIRSNTSLREATPTTTLSVNKGDNKMPYDQYGRYIPDVNPSSEGFGFDDLANIGTAGLLGYSGISAARNIAPQLMGINPVGNYQLYRQGAGNSVGRAVINASKDTASLARRGIQQGWRNMPGGAKIAGAIGAGIVANNMIGNPIGKGIDTITGQATNFDNDPQNAAVKAAQKQQRYEQTAGAAQRNAEIARLRNDPMQNYVDERSEKARREAREQDDYLFNRERNASKEQMRYQLSAGLGLELMNQWQQSARNVSNAMQNINNARLI